MTISVAPSRAHRTGVELRAGSEAKGKVEALRERLSKLSEASLRISESLDLKTVLREVLESARSLTGARTALIATVNGSGKLQDFVTCGLRSEERQWFRDMPLGPRLCGYMLEVASRPVRMEDMSAYLRSLGFRYDPVVLPTFLATPIRHQGVRVGSFYLGDKQTGEQFTSEDEEILAMFSSQAGAAIANARRHRDEKRARANLEALIETSPVGVVVFDCRTGKVLSFNRESQRILDRLGLPDHSPEEGLQRISVRRFGGRENRNNEKPLAQALRDVTTVRAEEMVIQGPDERSVTVLINATHLHSENGEAESLVVTVQDMTPIEEQERLRTEFLGLVSHELRAPLTSIKGCAASALGTPSALDPAETLQFFRIIDEQADHMRGLICNLLDVARIETGTLPVTPGPEDLAVIVDLARSTFLSGGGRNPVRIDLAPDLPRVLADRQRIVQVLGNLLSNAASHSSATSPIRVAATLEGVHVAVCVTDEGIGIPAERLPHLFRKFARSGGERRPRGLGAGLGLAICRGLVEAHGGRIWAESEGVDLGARFTFTLPVIEEKRSNTAISAAPPARRRRRASRTRVLVVDDDPQTLLYVRRVLEQAGYHPLVTGEVDEVPNVIEREKPQLVLLDLVLPGTDGIELMQNVPALADRPVIFLSGYGRDETIAKALDVGAADYIVKPFSPTELVARIQAALRRYALPSEPFQVGRLTIDSEERRVTLAGQPVPLTATEYELLNVLSINAGRVSTYDYLLRRVWGTRNSGDPRLVRAFVKKLRRKLDDDATNPEYILTEPRLGYRMAKSDPR